MSCARILLIEDHQATADTVVLYLRQAGYQVQHLDDGQLGLTSALSGQWDLLIIDIMLPKVNGREICQRVKDQSAVPVILLTALDAESERLAGFDAGADDYVSKPFSPRELVARVKARLRAPGLKDYTRQRIQLGWLSLDRDQRQAWVQQRALKLTPNEFDVLAVLAAAPGRAFTRFELVERAMGHDYSGSEKVIDTHIHRIRQQIASAGASKSMIETVFGYGYRINPRIKYSGKALR